MTPSKETPGAPRIATRPKVLGATVWARRLLRSGALGSIFVTLLFLSSTAVASSVLPLPPAMPGTVGSGAHAISPISPGVAGALATSSAHTTPAALSPSPAVTPPSNGSGTFFDNYPVPGYNSANFACGYGYYHIYCQNNTDEPSINYTSNGILAVAYTAFDNQTQCPGQSNTSSSVIGFTTSTNFGAKWTPAKYLSNPVCTGYDANFSSAAQPALTSLPNGTLVLAYEEYNLTSYCGYYNYTYCYDSFAPEFYYYYLWYDRIVVTESYDNGTTWTTPTVVNSVTNNSRGTYDTAGFPALQPTIADYGNTLYLAWTNWSYISFYGSANSEGVNFVTSTNGGQSWGSVSQLPDVAGYYSGTTHVAFNPYLLVLPNGSVEMAYATDFSQSIITVGTYTYYEPTVSIYLANSTDNGSSWTLHEVAGTIITQPICCAAEYQYDPVPTMTYSATTGQIFVAWDHMVFGALCQNRGTYGESCYTSETTWIDQVANSSDYGSTWMTHNISSQLVTFGPTSLWNAEFRPAISATPDGTLHLETMYENDSLCISTAYAGYCGVVQEVYSTSTDNGTTWTDPILVSPNYTANGELPYELATGWVGQYASMLSVGQTVVLAWTNEACTITFGYCYAPYEPLNATVVVSTLYTGTGLTLTFKETGLPATASWSASIMGNFREGAAGTSLSVSGVPPGQAIAYSVPWFNQSYGVVYVPTITPAGPSTFAASTTITVTFAEEVLFVVQSTPVFGYYCWVYSGECSNYEMSPAPGAQWVTPGTAITLSLYTVPWSTFAYPGSNMSFLSWTGTGPGNYTGLSPNITVTPTGPVNETANFVVNAYCWIDYTFSNVCLNQSSFPLTFLRNSALPNGTTWNVTIVTQNGTVVTQSTTTDSMTFGVPATPTEFFVWTVPGATTGQYWVPTTNVESPVEPLTGQLVKVNFTLEAANSTSFSTRFIETGLPAGTAWSLELGSSSYGVQSNNTTMTVAGGGPYSVNASVVYLENGYGYYAASVSSSQYVVNDSSTTTSATPGSISVDGPGVVTITYKAMYLLTTLASTGGSVTPAAGWYTAGTAITLNESPAVGYHFVGWAGSGSGSTTSSQDSQASPVITPTGPVTEFATFRKNSAPTWNLSIVSAGLPTGTGYSVSLGLNTYSGTGQFTVGEIQNGSYAVAVPYVYYNSTNTTRFVPTEISSSLNLGANDLLSIVGNGTLTIDFQAQYLLTVASTPASGGTVAPVPGQYWDDSGESIALTATPASGWEFVGWNASVSSATTTSASQTVILSSPLTVTGQFKVIPIGPPALFGLTVTETGLPTGLAWNVSVGTNGASGPTASLKIANLNGTYTVTVPTVASGVGTRWMANETTISGVSVVQNQSIAITFTEQFEVTVTSGSGGSITPAGQSWVGTGGPLTLTATANATSSFINWTGSGSGAYTGTAATTTITVTGPISELANFGPVYKTPPNQVTGSTTAGMPLALGLLVALLIAGLVVGLIVGGRRRSPPAAPPEEWQPASAEEPGVPASVYEETPETTETGGPG